MNNKETKIDATVIVPTYNRSTLLDYTLHSILNQDLGHQTIEVIVADDGSDDNTREIVRKYEPLMRLRYFFQDDKGYRVASARNMGIRNAQGEILIFVDSGVLLASGCIREHIQTHRAKEVPQAVIGYVYGYDQYIKNVDTFRDAIDILDPDRTIGLLRERGEFLDMRHDFYKSVNYSLAGLPAPWIFFVTCNVSATKASLVEVGMFDENYDYNWGVEDLDLGYRLHANDVSFVVNAAAESIHFPHDREATMKEKFGEEVANKKYFNGKYNTLATRLFMDCTFVELNDKILALQSEPSRITS
ncbi:glycosyltransferase [Chryseolinea lacunae]|uniref:Glycosyltransferase n=1 Tax=Chryseolinea lacunae TaxID=2801331 RepID=A0ABS1KXL6_9BACT|nr:glycosyltransferase [Chryseolinea lacunae]MBL0743046.1 glycosyltransferase [Chryseolinea lacunae]